MADKMNRKDMDELLDSVNIQNRVKQDGTIMTPEEVREEAKRRLMNFTPDEPKKQ